MSIEDSYFQTIISPEEEHALIVGRLQFKIQSLEQALVDVKNLSILELQKQKEKYKFINLKYLKLAQNMLKMKDEHDLALAKLIEQNDQIILVKKECENKIQSLKIQQQKILGKLAKAQFTAPNIVKIETRTQSQIQTDQASIGDLQQMNKSCKSSNMETSSSDLKNQVLKYQIQIQTLKQQEIKLKERIKALQQQKKELLNQNTNLDAKLIQLVKNQSKIESQPQNSQKRSSEIIIPMSPRVGETSKIDDRYKKLEALYLDLKKKNQVNLKMKEQYKKEIEKLNKKFNELKQEKNEISKKYDQLFNEEVSRQMEL